MTETNRNMYPPMILLMIAVFLIFSGWSAHRASGLGSEVSDHDYYSRGLKYTATQLEKKAAETMGWKLAASIKDHGLELRLNDRTGQAVDQAVGTLYLALPGTADNLHLALREISPGRYRVDLADDIKGSVKARLDLERHGARLNRQLLLNL